MAEQSIAIAWRRVQIPRRIRVEFGVYFDHLPGLALASILFSFSHHRLHVSSASASRKRQTLELTPDELVTTHDLVNQNKAAFSATALQSPFDSATTAKDYDYTWTCSTGRTGHCNI